MKVGPWDGRASGSGGCGLGGGTGGAQDGGLVRWGLCVCVCVCVSLMGSAAVGHRQIAFPFLLLK